MVLSIKVCFAVIRAPENKHPLHSKHGGSTGNMSTSFIKPQLAKSGWASLSKGQLTRRPL